MSTLKTLREQKKFSKEYVASAVGVSSMTVRNWEAGTRRPGILNAVKLAQALNIPLEDLQKLFT